MVNSEIYKPKKYSSKEFAKLYEKVIEEFLAADLKGVVVTIYYLPYFSGKKPTLQIEFNTVPKVRQDLDKIQELFSHIAFIDYYRIREDEKDDIPQGYNFMNLFYLVKDESSDGDGWYFSHESTLTSDDFYESLEGKEKWMGEVIERIRNGEELNSIVAQEEKRLAGNRAANRLLRMK